MRPIYIFDLDGTLALIDHRRHLVNTPPCPVCEGRGMVETDHNSTRLCDKCSGMRHDPDAKPDRDAFNKACVDDAPNRAIIRIFDTLIRSGADVRIFSGRSDNVRKQTIDWLWDYTETPGWNEIDEMLTMRETGDFTEDAILKLRWLGLMEPEERERIVCVFDGRDSVVKMWRENGLTCLQVAPGAF